MNFTFLHLHQRLFSYLFATIALTVMMSLNLGEFKPTDSYDLFDVAGEGGITLMTLIWIFFTLVSRPAGRVTNLLFIGLMLTHVSMLLDLLDEFIIYPDSYLWLNTIESLPAPFGMIIMTIALYYWHQEQHVINNQLQRTERYYREHSLTDFTTGLYSGEYMKNQLQYELNSAKSNQSYFALMMFDLRNFSSFNAQHGYLHGDKLLRQVAKLILMNIRDCDLACRYASDRFIVLLPNTQLDTSAEIAIQIETAIAHFAYKIGNSSSANYLTVTSCVNQYRGWHNYQDILTDINQAMVDAKSPNKVYA